MPGDMLEVSAQQALDLAAGGRIERLAPEVHRAALDESNAQVVALMRESERARTNWTVVPAGRRWR